MEHNNHPKGRTGGDSPRKKTSAAIKDGRVHWLDSGGPQRCEDTDASEYPVSVDTDASEYPGCTLD